METKGNPVKSPLLASALGVVLATAAGAVVWMSLPQDHSDNYRAVRDDPSWLGYLPVPRDGIEPKVTGFQPNDSAIESLRVDLLVEPAGDSVSLCFAATEEEAGQVCGRRAAVLGRTERDVELPWVSQLGETEVDLLDHLGAPVPLVDEVPSLAE